MKKKDWFSKYPTVEQINKTLEDINSIYRVDFDSLIKERPPKERKGILRTDIPFSSFYNNDYLDGASPEKVVIIKGHNPQIRFITINSKYIDGFTLDAYSLFEKIKRVQYHYDEDIFSRIIKKQFEKEIQKLKANAEEYEEERKRGPVPKIKRLNELFKKNGLNLEAIKTKTSGLFNYKNINFDEFSSMNYTILIKDTSKPDTYYVSTLDQVYNAVKFKDKQKLSKLLKRAYPVKYINKLLQDAGTKVILDYDDNKVISHVESNHYSVYRDRDYGNGRWLRLKCVKGHEIEKKYTLENLLNIIDKKEEIPCPYCSGEIKKKKEHGTSFPEKWFYEQLVSKIDDSKYRDKIKISEFNNKEELDTKYQGKNQNQDIDVLIKFPNEVEYKGKKIKGIGVACNGPLYHSYITNKGIQVNDSYNNTNINDTIRYNSFEYMILNWNERNCSSEKSGRNSADSFIENRIFPILRFVFEGNREIYDQNTYSKQMQHQRLGEIAQALNDKCKIFQYGNIKIENLGKYFLLNKKRFAYTGGVYDKNKVKIWSWPLNDKFVINDDWKKEIYKEILYNDDYLKANKISKGTVDYINKNSRDINLDLKQYDKVRERRQFAKLFKEIKKRTSK